MKTFKQFLSEGLKRHIPHFQDISDKEFQQVQQYLNQPIKISLKVDGCPIIFGKDSNHNFYLQTNNSGIIQKQNAFSEYTKAKKDASEEMLQRAKHYDEIYQILEDSDLWKDLDKDSKIETETLYNPMAQEEKGQLKFVSVCYDKSKLGKLMTLFPLDEKCPILDKSNGNIKIINPNLGHIDLSNCTKDKHEIANTILNHNFDKKDSIGNEIEGIVFEINGKKYKVTTKKYQEMKKQERLLGSK
jgi:hypothetical protein